MVLHLRGGGRGAGGTFGILADLRRAPGCQPRTQTRSVSVEWIRRLTSYSRAMHLAGLVGRSHPTLKIEPYQGVLFIHPPKDIELLDDDLAAPKDHRFHGTATLALHKPREITSLTVKLIAYYTVSLPGHG